jgi:hypothetical protein
MLASVIKAEIEPSTTKHLPGKRCFEDLSNSLELGTFS